MRLFKPYLLIIWVATGCHLVERYRPHDAAPALDLGRDAPAGETSPPSDGLVDGAIDADGEADTLPPPVDAGAACLDDWRLWTAYCVSPTESRSCFIACGDYSVNCSDTQCSCLLTNVGSRVCKGPLDGTASCEPDSICYQAVKNGCCERL